MTFGDSHAPAIDTDVVVSWVGLRAELVHRDAVHGHAAFNDQLFGGAPGCDARAREDLLQSFHGFIVSGTPVLISDLGSVRQSSILRQPSTFNLQSSSL